MVEDVHLQVSQDSQDVQDGVRRKSTCLSFTITTSTPPKDDRLDPVEVLRPRLGLRWVLPGRQQRSSCEQQGPCSWQQPPFCQQHSASTRSPCL
ncbi:hypothetical protein E2C01_000916 [Portunus trituberculatus]|uniref:Uncharacterized protein n=1 Tax=Portunus trituberculatus TaxID=210409 RepID=A0A5B7CGH5_PORTR|nr:hypothetical protein [Portunus trituberculatus]